jgi:hypothetical protein
MAAQSSASVKPLAGISGSRALKMVRQPPIRPGANHGCAGAFPPARIPIRKRAVAATEQARRAPERAAGIRCVKRVMATQTGYPEVIARHNSATDVQAHGYARRHPGEVAAQRAFPSASRAVAAPDNGRSGAAGPAARHERGATASLIVR